MSETPLADILQKLKEVFPDSPEWIMNRFDALCEERLPKIEEEGFKKGVRDTLSLSRIIEGTGNVLTGLFQTRARKPVASPQDTMQNRHGETFEMMRLAVCDFISTQGAHRSLFTNSEVAYLTADGRATNPNLDPDEPLFF